MRWEDPPAAGGSRTNWSAIVEELKANPGRWALVKTSPTKPASVYDYVRTRYGLEAVIRRTDESYNLYARWPEERPTSITGVCDRHRKHGRIDDGCFVHDDGTSCDGMTIIPDEEA